MSNPGTDGDISAVDIYEGNAPARVPTLTATSSHVGTPSHMDSPRHTLVPLDNEEEQLTYQKIMQRIIQRYIFDIQREAEVTEGRS